MRVVGGGEQILTSWNWSEACKWASALFEAGLALMGDHVVLLLDINSLTEQQHWICLL